MPLKGIKISMKFSLAALLFFMAAIQPLKSGSGAGYNTGNDGKINAFSTRDSINLKVFMRMAEVSLKKGVAGYPAVRAYIDSALSTCNKLSISVPPALLLLQARYSFETGDYSRSEQEITLAEKRAEETADNEALSGILLFKGSYLLRTGFFKESTETFNRAIDVARLNRISWIIPIGYQGISDVMHAAGDFQGYNNYLRLMINAALDEKDTVVAELGLQRLGNSYIDHIRNSSRADSAYRRCLELSFPRKDTYYISFISANIGWNFYLQKKLDSAKHYYNQSLNFSLKGNQESVSANSLGNLGSIYRDLGEFNTAKAYYRKSIYFASRLNDCYTLSWVYKDISDLYLKTRDSSSAFRNYILYKQYNDTLLLKKNNQGLADARLRYEADTHRKEVELLSWRLKNNRLLIFGFAGLVVLTAVIAGLLITGSKINNKRRISEMNRKVSELTQANLRQQMNPHFIFNTLNSIQYYMFHHDKIATNNYLTKFSSLMRKVLENSRSTTITLQDELEALNLYLELESLRFRDKFDYSVTVDDEIDPLLYKVPAMLIQPYVENSICHGLMPLDRKGLVKIGINLGEDHLVCIIEDNGIGREAAGEIRKLKGTGHDSLGTRITSSRLDLVNSYYGTDMTVFYTDLVDEHGNPSGTRVEIHIPILR